MRTCIPDKKLTVSSPGVNFLRPTFTVEIDFGSVCYHAAGSIFILGVIEDTALNAAMLTKTGAPEARALRAWGGKTGPPGGTRSLRAGVERMAALGESRRLTVIVKMPYRLNED